MGSQRQAGQKIGLTPAPLASIKQQIGFRVIGGRLRTGVGNPNIVADNVERVVIKLIDFSLRKALKFLKISVKSL